MSNTIKLTAAALILCLGTAASAQVTLGAMDFDGKDSEWTDRSGGTPYTCMGLNGTGSSIDGDIWWNSFPGETGRYRIYLQAILETDGNSPYKIFVGGTLVASSSYPFYGGGDKDCGATAYEESDLDCGVKEISQGDEIRMWAQSVYPCGSDHGQYARFTGIRFEPTTDEVTPNPGDEQVVTGDEVYYPDAIGEKIVVEIESCPIPHSDWHLETEYAGYSGDGYYVWRGPQSFGSPPGADKQLTYKIYICEAGQYWFKYRNHLIHDNHEENNDYFVSIDDYSFRKTMSHIKNQWSWYTIFDPCWCSGDFNLDEGEHTVKIQPRSSDFCIDKFIVYKAWSEQGFDTNESDPDHAVTPTANTCDGSVIAHKSAAVRYKPRARAAVEAAYTIDGRRLDKNMIAGAAVKALPAGVVVVRYTDGSVSRMVNGKVVKR
ncbi:MAG: hypothetical protein GF418_13360 [Chitinivibrionales bacterium]|nr:hypothetical protein [Chitinivibrionales bacterium]MBD3396607.1 hypothetical protein [Chitinivibrionales bacterium]